MRSRHAGEWRITGVIVESPSTAGVGRSGSNDLLGTGWARVETDEVVLAIRPRGVAGFLMPQRRRYPARSISGWEQRGARIEFTGGHVGLFATDGAEMPVRIVTFHCADPGAAGALTDRAMEVGLAAGRVTRRG